MKRTIAATVVAVLLASCSLVGMLSPVEASPCKKNPDHWKCQAPTPSATLTPSPIATPTLTPSPTATPTAVATPTATPSPTPSPTPTLAPTPAPTATPTPSPTPEPSTWGPPLSQIRYETTPNIALPGRLQPITDPVFGTTITRIGNAGQRHAYSRIQPWSPSEKYLFLHYGGQWLLDGKTYAPIKQLNTPYVATWVSDSEMVGTRGSRLVRYNVETGADTTLHDFGVNVSLGEGEGAPSDDFRYWALQGSSTVYVYDRNADTVIASRTLGATPNNVTMSALGNYVVVQFSTGGSGLEQGTWLYDRNLTRIRQLFAGTDHMDACLTAANEESVVHIASGAVGFDRLQDGQKRNLAKLPNVWAWVGHVSCFGPSGWALMSPNSFHDPAQWGGVPGNDQTASLDMSQSEATMAKVWGHQHNLRVGYENSPMSVSSPSGTRVLFASDWGTSLYYPFISEVTR